MFLRTHGVEPDSRVTVLSQDRMTAYLLTPGGLRDDR